MNVLMGNTLTNGVEVEVLEKPQRRRFSLEYKRRIVREADRCRKPGEVGGARSLEGQHRGGMVMSEFAPVTEQMDAIRADTVEIIPEEDLARKLERSRQNGRPLRIKQGFDPTRPDLHIGHAVSIRKLRVFQEFGHEVVFVVGSGTARIGDPTGRDQTRPPLSPEEIAANARTYAEQVALLLDVSKARIEYNGQWLEALTLPDVIKLSSSYTVARMLERDDFADRYKEGVPISIHELLYPLMQAYDSIHLNADVELGGSDQRFNLLIGRTLMERYGLEPQVCLLMPLLRGTDGEKKMSKSFDNYIGVSEAPEEQFGKTMSIPDSLLEEWYQLTGIGSSDLVLSDPYRAKRALARHVVRTYHGADLAGEAEAHFDRVIKEGRLPDEIPHLTVSLSDPALRYEESGRVSVAALLMASGLAPSFTEAGRLIEQGAISVNEQKVVDREATWAVDAPIILRRGKRRFAKLVFE